MTLNEILKRMMDGRIPPDRELNGGLHVRFKKPDGISQEFRLIAYRINKPVSNTELIVLRRELEALIEYEIKLDEKEYVSGDKLCRVFRWQEAKEWLRPSQMGLGLHVTAVYE